MSQTPDGTQKKSYRLNSFYTQSNSSSSAKKKPVATGTFVDHEHNYAANFDFFASSSYGTSSTSTAPADHADDTSYHSTNSAIAIAPRKATPLQIVHSDDLASTHPNNYYHNSSLHSHHIDGTAGHYVIKNRLKSVRRHLSNCCVLCCCCTLAMVIVVLALLFYLAHSRFNNSVLKNYDIKSKDLVRPQWWLGALARAHIAGQVCYYNYSKTLFFFTAKIFLFILHGVYIIGWRFCF